MAKTEYEKQREANIARNREHLEALGLSNLNPKPKKAAKQFAEPKPAPRKRKAVVVAEGNGDAQNDRRKTVRLDSAEGVHADGIRRSARNAGKSAVDYNKPVDFSIKTIVPSRKIPNDKEPRSTEQRTHNPRQYGHITGVPVGSWWDSRRLCSIDAIHAPWVAGIAPGPHGAYSVALSGGYEDDVDLGYGFTYTGSGGRDLKGTAAKPKNLRTAPQSSDQSFENTFNGALKRSSETKRPIRVIRGFKLQSPWAPSEGYRYDGLYTVEKAWLERGLQGFMVCKFAFKRLPSQPPLAENEDGDGRTDEEDGGD